MLAVLFVGFLDVMFVCLFAVPVNNFVVMWISIAGSTA